MQSLRVAVVNVFLWQNDVTRAQIAKMDLMRMAVVSRIAV